MRAVLACFCSGAHAVSACIPDACAAIPPAVCACFIYFAETIAAGRRGAFTILCTILAGFISVACAIAALRSALTAIGCAIQTRFSGFTGSVAARGGARIAINAAIFACFPCDAGSISAVGGARAAIIFAVRAGFALVAVLISAEIVRSALAAIACALVAVFVRIACAVAAVINHNPAGGIFLAVRIRAINETVPVVIDIVVALPFVVFRTASPIAGIAVIVAVRWHRRFSFVALFLRLAGGTAAIITYGIPVIAFFTFFLYPVTAFAATGACSAITGTGCAVFSVIAGLIPAHPSSATPAILRTA